MKTLIFISLLLVPISVLKAGEAPPDLPLAVASFGAAAMPDGSLYFFGGHSGRRHKYNRDEVHGDLFRWKPDTPAWDALAKDEPAQGASLVATQKGLIRIGGMAARNAKGEKQDLWSSDRAARYDIDSSRWASLPRLPQRRSSHDSIVCGGTLYVMGGWMMEGEADSVWHDTYLTLDLRRADAKWESHPQPFKRRAIAVQCIGTKVYVIGGMLDDNKLSTAVSVLDTKTSTWSEGPSLPSEKIGGFGFAAAAYEGRLFASGLNGRLLELRGNDWVAVAKLAHPRYFHRLLSIGGGTLIAIGGESDKGGKAPPEAIHVPAADSPPLSDEPTKAATPAP